MSIFAPIGSAFGQLGVFAQSDEPSITDNEVLDQWRIPFGDWVDQSVDWIDTEAGTVLDAIEWPFDALITLVIDNILLELPWLIVVLGMGLIATLARNVKQGVFTVVALTICGLLGNEYWDLTAKTIGFIAVAVFLCVLIGIPVGVLCGRIDSVWGVVRPALDAMQVVHSFVYMLPFIFFWGIGEVSATMVTMVFALPPLVRLTNLGIRQVPEDVVEASRAYGAPERTVLFDVQLPLARPAIMTGINQTLLLSISMLGIAAIMGAGGLARPMFQALSNQDPAQSGSSGLSFFLVAVVLDRITQRDEDTRSLFSRLRGAWTNRNDVDALLAEAGIDPDAIAESAEQDPMTVRPYFAPASTPERLPMGAVALGGVLAIVSVFLTWTSDAGKVSAYGRRADEQELVGSSFNGLEASGGSWFGFVVLAAGIFLLACVIKVQRAPGRGPRWLTTDGAAIAGMVVLLTVLSHVLLAPSPLAVDPGTGPGVIVALVGGLVATVGALRWVQVAPHSPLTPLPETPVWSRIVAGATAVVVLVIAMFSGWTFDERADTVITPEIQAQIDELRQKAADEPENAAVYASQINSVRSAAVQEKVVIDGISDDGPRLGLWLLLAGVVGLAGSVVASGVFGSGERRLWFWNTVTVGVGGGIATVSLAWIASLARVSDPNLVSGVGAFMALLAGAALVAGSRSVLNEFRRTTVYPDIVRTGD